MYFGNTAISKLQFNHLAKIKLYTILLQMLIHLTVLSKRSARKNKRKTKQYDYFIISFT